MNRFSKILGEEDIVSDPSTPRKVRPKKTEGSVRRQPLTASPDFVARNLPRALVSPPTQVRCRVCGISGLSGICFSCRARNPGPRREYASPIDDQLRQGYEGVDVHSRNPYPLSDQLNQERADMDKAISDAVSDLTPSDMVEFFNRE